MRRLTINDEDRRQWVDNDEGLHDLQRASRQPIRKWIRANRELIDAVIRNVRDGVKPAHYLKYGGRQ